MPASSVTVIVFLKEPVPGRVKTRLARDLGEAEAASIYRAFVADTLNLSRAVPLCQLRLALEGDAGSALWPPEVARVLRAERVRIWSQAAGDLGARLGAALARAAAEGSGPVLFLGTDCPDLPLTHLQRALRCLESPGTAALGPVADGGVWCIGLHGAPPDFFADLPWSCEHTGEALLERARSRGLATPPLPDWYDCDTFDDLRALAARLREGRSRAKMTLRWLDAHPHPVL